MNTSGQISLGGAAEGQSINIEVGNSATTEISLGGAQARLLAQTPTGPIVMPTNFYGKKNQYIVDITTNQVNANLRTLAVNAGWNQSTLLTMTIETGVIFSSNSTGTPALTVNGSFPGGVQLINKGTIVAMGGNGGNGGGFFDCNCGIGRYSGAPGGGGGTGIVVSVPISIDNADGTIAGGGGGGGGGGAGAASGPRYGGGGGGGGRSSAAANSGGGGGGANLSTGAPGGTGGPGTYSSPGNGGGAGGGNAGAGGVGGAWGSSGAVGGSGFQPGGGGAGGQAVVGNGNINWIATGNRFGGIS